MSLKSSLIQVLILLFVAAPAFTDDIPEIRIIASVQEMISIFQESNYWGELEPDKILQVPPVLIVATVKEWRQEAAEMTVQDKKALF
jgi:hypothetical protein